MKSSLLQTTLQFQEEFLDRHREKRDLQQYQLNEVIMKIQASEEFISTLKESNNVDVSF